VITRDPLPGVPGHTTEANPYAYGYNDPVNRVDPTGKRPQDTDFDPPMVPISSTSPSDPCAASDQELPSEAALQSYGLQGVSAHEEHCLELANVANDNTHPSVDTRTTMSSSNIGGSVGADIAYYTSSAEQAALCISLSALWNDPGACALLQMMVGPAGDVVVGALAGERDPIKAGAPGKNAVRHFAWLALVTAYFTAEEFWDARGVQKASALTEVHEVAGLTCNGTPNECRWDRDADANNNQLGLEFGQQQSMQDANMDDRKRMITDKAKEYLNSPGHLDLRGGCPSRHITVSQGC
jgi:hypothetical protein